MNIIIIILLVKSVVELVVDWRRCLFGVDAGSDVGLLLES